MKQLSDSDLKMVTTVIKDSTTSSIDDLIWDHLSWSVLYHLSPFRCNLIDWLIPNCNRILEIGGECGALIPAYIDKAQHVDCIEQEEQGRDIIKERFCACENLSVFADLSEIAPNKYDQIICIGDITSKLGIFDCENSIEDAISAAVMHLKSHLEEGGRIILGVENPMGLHFWAGDKYDKEAIPFATLTKTETAFCGLSRRQIENIAEKSGMQIEMWYYPYPDLFFPEEIFSDLYLPQVGQLRSNARNYQTERLQMFDEGDAYDQLIVRHEFESFSNAYMVTLVRRDME